MCPKEINTLYQGVHNYYIIITSGKMGQRRDLTDSEKSEMLFRWMDNSATGAAWY